MLMLIPTAVIVVVAVGGDGGGAVVAAAASQLSQHDSIIALFPLDRPHLTDIFHPPLQRIFHREKHGYL